MKTTKNVEQRIIIKFLIKADKTNAEIKTMLQSAFGTSTTKRSTLYEGTGRFREGRMSVTDDPREDGPRTARTPAGVAKVKRKTDEDRRGLLRDVAGTLKC